MTSCEGGVYIQRNYSLTEKEDYRINVLPYKLRGGRVEGTYICRNPAMVLTGWNLVEMGPGMINDSSYPSSNGNLDPSRGYHGW